MRILLVVLMSLMATTAMARSPWYVGGGIGETRYDTNLDLGAAKLDSWEAGYQLFAGYQLGSQWAIEGGYINFSETEDFDAEAIELEPGVFQGVGYKFKSSGIYVNGQYHIPIAKAFSVDLSGGWIFTEAKSKAFGDSNTDVVGLSDNVNDNGLMLGAALTWQANDMLYLRGSTHYFMVDYGDIDYGDIGSATVKNPWRFSLDLVWNF